ncbi:DUF4127 family protein, partial [Phascolarctobacterium succinatutens]
MMKVLRSVLLCALLLTTHTAFAAKGTLLYIPMDNRPVCLDYTVQTMQAAGWDVQLPPAEYIAGAQSAGQPEELFNWLEAKAGESVAIV